MKILIVGAGLTGACSALVLARRGHDVTVIEKGELGQATTANSGSAILYQTKETDLLLTMTARGLLLWDALRAEGLTPFRRDGSHVLFAGAEEESFAARRAAFLSGHGVQVERLDRAALLDRLPGLPADITGSFHCAVDGEANPLASCIDIARAAQHAGASFIFHDACVALTFQGDQVTSLRTASGLMLTADAVLLAAGQATAALAAGCGVDLPVYPERGEQLLTYPQPPTLKGRFLSVRYTRGKAKGAFVGLALGQEPDGRIKIGSTRETGQSDLVTSERGRQGLLEELAFCLPQLARLPIERHTVGIRIGSRTGRPIVARLPGRDGVFVIDGLGGNGVAFAPLVAELAADLIDGTPDPLHPQLTF